MMVLADLICSLELRWILILFVIKIKLYNNTCTSLQKAQKSHSMNYKNIYMDINMIFKFKMKIMPHKAFNLFG